MSSRPCLGALALVVLFCGGVSAQTTLYFPDVNPNLNGGTSVNVFPFGNSAFTYMARVPTSLLDPQNPRITDISFAPSGSGTWNPGTGIIALGHLPNPVPCPFTFPGPGGSTPGSFLDLTVVYDSSIHQPLNWVWNPTTWSPMGLATATGIHFDWNGVDDVGFFVTFTGATATSGCYRNPTGPPFRSYTNTYQASTSSACEATSGLVMAFDVEPGNNELAVSSSASQNFLMTLDAISPTATQGVTLLTVNTAGPLGQGAIFGIEPSPATWYFLFTSPLQDGSPFSFPVPSSLGLWPNIPFALPNGAVAPLVGATMDFVVVLFKPGMSYDSKSNVARITF